MTFVSIYSLFLESIILINIHYISIAKTLVKNNKSTEELKKNDLFEVLPVCSINSITPFPLTALDKFETDFKIIKTGQSIVLNEISVILSTGVQGKDLF